MSTGMTHVPWNPEFRLVLASKSESRRQLLASAGIPFEVDPAQIDERALEAEFMGGGGSGDRLAAALARAKALEVSARNWNAYCLGADQVLSLEGRVLHKAATFDEARSHLSLLAGRTHELTSAFAIARNGEILHEDEDRAELTMRFLDATRIDRYLEIAGASALSSVGGYQLEALGIHLFERVEGGHATILGLPLLALLRWLRREGAILI